MPGNNDAVIKRQPALAEQVADFLVDEIERGAYPPGETLPSESELAKRLEVSRTVIREALARLKHDGFLESRQGSRTKVVPDPLRRVFRLQAPEKDQETWLAHLYELRAIMESEAAALAARRRTARHLSEIKKRLAAFEMAVQSGSDCTRESLAFHKSIIRASGNPHLVRLVDWVDAKIFALRTMDNEEDQRALLERVRREHTALVKAVEDGDSGLARKIALTHVGHAADQHGYNLDF